MELSQLAYFQTVARLSHVTRAAQAMSVSQPALSRSIANLEQELGTPLFHREGRNVILNEYGQAFLEYVDEALRTIEAGTAHIHEMLGVANRMVSLAFLPTLGPAYVPRLLKEFYSNYPDVQFQLSQNPNETIHAQLERGEIDLGLCLAPEEHMHIKWEGLFTEELFVVVPKGHRLASESSVRLEDIREESFIALKHGTGLRTVTDELFTQAGFLPHIAFEGEEVPTIAGLVGAGFGVSLVPKWSGAGKSSVSLLPVSEPICRRTIGIGWRRRRELSSAAARFRAHTLQYRS